tara:strand:+ start:985 stop:1146 length:162 start_codon:yes stop_codon:yes gene_type:complete
MKVGDLVRHTKTGFTSIVLALPGIRDAGMMNVWTPEGKGRWYMRNCEVVSASR